MTSEAIHPTAIIESGARLEEGVTVGAYAFIGASVQIGAGTRVGHHAVVEGRTSIGRNCEIFPYACLGLKTQDLKYRGGNPGLRIGDRNVFREFCTVHAATFDGDFTVIGDDNLFLAYSHVAHDCLIGNNVIMSNNATLAGHVQVDDHVIFGGLSGAHQFCRIGTRSMIGGCSKIVQDVPPYLIADGNPALIRSYNKVGLERAGYDPEQISRIKQAYRTFYRRGLNRSQALEAMRAEGMEQHPETERFVTFVGHSERGFVPGAK